MKKALIIMFVIAFLSFGFAHAADKAVTATLAVTGGNLLLYTNTDNFVFAPVDLETELNNYATGQTTDIDAGSYIEKGLTQQPSVWIFNARGNAAGGWHLDIQCTTALTNGTDTIPAGNINLNNSGSSIIRIVGQNTAVLTALDNEIGTARKVVSADNGGRGAYYFQVAPTQMRIKVPYSAVAGTYTGTITYTLTDAP